MMRYPTNLKIALETCEAAKVRNASFAEVLVLPKL